MGFLKDLFGQGKEEDSDSQFEKAKKISAYIRHRLRDRFETIGVDSNDISHVKYDDIRAFGSYDKGVVVAKIFINYPYQVKRLGTVAQQIENALFDPVIQFNLGPDSFNATKDTIRTYLDKHKILDNKELTAQWKYTLEKGK